MKKKAHLTQSQRYTISMMYQNGFSQKKIAETISKDKSVISREIKRNTNPKTKKYSFTYAQEMAEIRKERMNFPRKFKNDLKKEIIEKIKEDWSPEEITGWQKRNGKDHVSHETIYKFIRKNKAEGGKLYKHTRHKLKHRKRPAKDKIPIKNRVSIEQRPDIVNKKERFGDWEMDTIIGENNNGAIVTIVERTSKFMMMAKLEHGKNAVELTKVVVNLLDNLSKYVHTITCDNGTEFADHQNIAKLLNTKIFFTHPYSSWEKGLIENTNKLIRQYIPKKSNFNNINNLTIKQIQHKLNNRPRKNLNFACPKDFFFANLQ
jgi:IS30 family transposase